MLIYCGPLRLIRSPNRWIVRPALWSEGSGVRTLECGLLSPHSGALTTEYMEHWNSHHIRGSRVGDVLGGVPKDLYSLPEHYGDRLNCTSNSNSVLTRFTTLPQGYRYQCLASSNAEKHCFKRVLPRMRADALLQHSLHRSSTTPTFKKKHFFFW